MVQKFDAVVPDDPDIFFNVDADDVATSGMIATAVSSAIAWALEHRQAHGSDRNALSQREADADEGSSGHTSGDGYQRHCCRYALALMLVEAEKEHIRQVSLPGETSIDPENIREEMERIQRDSPALLEQPVINRLCQLLGELAG